MCSQIPPITNGIPTPFSGGRRKCFEARLDIPRLTLFPSTIWNNANVYSLENDGTDGYNSDDSEDRDSDEEPEELPAVEAD